MQPITADFVFTNVRIALIATVAYLGGAGYFSPAGVTLATALITSLLPILIPWAMSAYASWGIVKVPADLKINGIAVENAGGGLNTPAPIAAVIEQAKKAAPLILLCLLILPMAACTTAQKNAGTSAAATVIRSVPDLQSRTAYLCKFVPAAEVVTAIFRVDTGTVGQIATGICNSLKTQVATYGIMSREPSYKGVILRGKFVP